MRNLLEMERNMLEMSETFRSTFAEISVLDDQISTGTAMKLNAKIKQGNLAIDCKKWLKKPATKRMFEENDLLIWSIDEMAMKFFNVKQSQMNRMCKAYKNTTINPDYVGQFLAKCNEEEETGKNVVRSIDNFNKFVKGLVTNEEESVSASVPTIFTLSFKVKEIDQNAERNIAVRIDENMELTSKNEQDEIVKAMKFLASKLEGVSVLTGVDTGNLLQELTDEANNSN
jgi:hypothetical protein